MIFLFAAIVAASLNQLLFKALPRRRVDLLGAMTVNYAVCAVFSGRLSPAAGAADPIFSSRWFPLAVLQGGLFAAGLFLMGRTTERRGVAAASLATRVSVAIPTIAAFFLYGDAADAPTIIGLGAAFLALILSSGDRARPAADRAAGSLLPVLLFISFGLYAALLKYAQERFLSPATYRLYLAAAFAAAFLICALVWMGRFLARRRGAELKDLVAGLILGCTNFGSVYFLYRALAVPGSRSSRIFPTISIAVVVLSALGARLAFQERISRRMLLALAIGIGSIGLIYL